MSKNGTGAAILCSAVAIVAIAGAVFYLRLPAPSSPSANAPETMPPNVSSTVLVSSGDRLKYCNGADMDSEGYANTLTVEKPVVLPGYEEVSERAESAVLAATDGMCRESLERAGMAVMDGVLHIGPIGAWAGVSIVMCSCRPEVEANALRVPGVTRVVWD